RRGSSWSVSLLVSAETWQGRWPVACVSLMIGRSPSYRAQIGRSIWHFPLGKALIAPIFPPGMKQALIALEDGRIFYGEPFGAARTTVGEICFNTTMTGYQEVLTDPSYCGQIVTMTYPLIGNYGVNELDDESVHPHVRGFV